MLLSSAEKSRRGDNYTITELCVSSLTLMERASGHIAKAALSLMKDSSRAAVFCGPGNNGGDGIGAAICLAGLKKEVRVFLVGPKDRMTPDSIEMERRLAAFDIGLTPFFPGDRDIEAYVKTCGVIIDAIFGIGLKRPLEGAALDCADLINSLHIPTVSADIPSGINADTGEKLGGAVKADVTVTFSRPKPGHFLYPGYLHTGKLITADIGVVFPPDGEPDTFVMTDEDIKLPQKARDGHKGTFGKLLIVGGSTGYTGAPAFAAKAAVKSGAGLVFLGVPQDIYTIEAVKNDEAMVFPLPSDRRGRISALAEREISEKLHKATVCLIGPGLGISQDIDKVISSIISRSNIPLVIDADGINAVSHNINILDTALCPVVLTPHDGEFARLAGAPAGGDRISAARDFAKAHNVILVLKGHRTITAFPDGEVFINTTGNPGMAKGGSGDVLAGMAAAFMCQNFGLKEAVLAAVYLHGRAGDLCAEKFGEYSMTPSDMIDAISNVTR